MNKLLAASLIIFICFYQSHAQNTIQPAQVGKGQGIIITKELDTLRGVIPIAVTYRGNLPIIKDGDKEPTIISCKNIQTIVNENATFESVSFNRKKEFIEELMHVRSKGTLNLYVHREGKDPRDISFLAYIYIIQKDGMTSEVPKKKFKDFINPLISDNSELLKKTEKNVYKYDDIERIVYEYNQN